MTGIRYSGTLLGTSDRSGASSWRCVAESPCRSLRVTVRTQPADVLLDIVLRVTVDVLELEGDRFALPLADPATGAFVLVVVGQVCVSGIFARLATFDQANVLEFTPALMGAGFSSLL